jgi:chemotaxis protein CheZ
MSDLNTLRHDLVGMVEDLRATLQNIGEGDLPRANLVSNARDRLRYIATLTEQSAGQSLNAAEAIGDRLRAQQARAAELVAKTRSPEIRAFLASLQVEHEQSRGDVSDIIQAQAFQDLVGQVINKLLVLVQKLEDNLIHLLVEDVPDPELLAGPAVTPEAAVSQDEIDDLFG